MKFWPIIILVCLSCTISTVSYAWSQQQKRVYYAQYSKKCLAGDFKRAGLVYPSKHLALLVFKQSKRMQLYASNDDTWHFIKTFPIKAASGGPGPKLHSGDRQVPEGMYRIVALNPHSHFLLSMELNYPNAFDQKEARIYHHHHLGNDIFIHGKASSIGCIAIGDRGIEQLYPLVAAVGIHHVQVIIAPDDLRYKKPMYGKVHPHWLPTLYHRIRLALSHFPLQNRV